MIANFRDKDTITFGVLIKKNANNQARKQDEPSSQIIYLLSKSNSISIFDIIPKDFTISTKNSKGIFNLEMLKEVSPIISNLIKENQSQRQYSLDIDDEENVLSKFEHLFLGQRVDFVEDDIHCSKQITKLLQITNFPNPLKPQSLQQTLREEFRNQSIYRGPTIPVEIHRDCFAKFLKRNVYQSFKIITKNNEYMCNIFGVYSSKVIQKILNEDSNSNQCFYNFQDEYNEFQLICDFFNFDEIVLTRSNMNSIKKIVDDLQIDCILDQVNSYIENCDKNYQKISDKQKIIESIEDLFDMLYNIKIIGIENVKASICQSKFSKKKEDVQELAAYIIQVVKPDFSLQKEMAELMIELNKESNETNQLSQLIPFIIDKLMIYYMPFRNNDLVLDTIEPIDLTNKCVYSFIRILYKKGIIPKEMIIERLKNYDCKNKSINAFFLPEIIEINPKNKNLIEMIDLKSEINLQYMNFIHHVKKFLPDKIDLYEKMLDDMEPIDELTKSIRYDDVDALQSIITRNSVVYINEIIIPYNIFDDFENSPNILNYSALCGSIKCFKYLLLNTRKVNEETFYFAVYGGNVEIIKIVNQNLHHTHHSVSTPSFESTHIYKLNKSILWFNFYDKIGYGYEKPIDSRDRYVRRYDDPIVYRFFEQLSKYSEVGTMENITMTSLNYCNINNIIASTIALHRNGLFDWIFEKEYVNKNVKENDLFDLAILSAATGNVHSLIKLIDEGLDIASNSQFYDIIYFCAKNGFYKLLQLILSINEHKYIFSYKNVFMYDSSILFGNLSIFKLFVNNISIPSRCIKFNILLAINLNYKDIISYYFDNVYKISDQIDQQFVNMSLKHALKIIETNDLLIYLIEKYKKINPKFINTNAFIQLLDTASLYSNLLATKYLTDLILSEFPDSDFSNAFITASSSGSMNICKYFIDKKVNINYYEFLSDVNKLGSMDAEHFEMVYNKVDQSTKYQLLGCIEKAIENKNKKLIEFILKKNISIPNGLHCAVKTHDVEIVDLILRYNNEPSFVNRLSKSGTAIFYAASFRDLDMVKRLLSVKGIDPGLFNLDNKNALTEAINNFDYDIVEAILDFYGDNIASNTTVVSSAFQAFKNCSNKYADECMWKIIKKFLSIKSIDPNFIINSTLLYKACEKNEIEVVEFLLKLDKIDVNQYDIKTYNSPLIISVIKRNIEIVKLLINHPKTNINFRNMVDKTALTLAAEYDQEEVIDLLVNDKRFDQYESKLCYALINLNDKIFKKLLSLDFVDVNYFFSLSKRNRKVNDFDDSCNYCEFLTTLLVHYAKVNNESRINMIINHPSFDCNKSNVNLAIFYSIKENNINFFRKLIKFIDNDVNNIYDKHGRSFLVTAAIHSSGDIIDEIFNNPGFDARKNQIFRAFVDSYTIPSIYKQRMNLRIANPPPNYHPQTIINQRLLPDKSTVVEIMEKIINYDENHDHLIDLNKLTQSGKSVFTSILIDNEETSKITELLLNHGADPNVQDSEGVLPFEHAVIHRNMMNPLLDSNKIDFGMKFNYLYRNEQKPIKTTHFHVAASMNDCYALMTLLNKYPDGLNAEDELGETPLMTACRTASISNVDFLFNKNDLDFLHRNKEGKDALEIIQKLPPDEAEYFRKNREDYHQKIVKLLASLNIEFN